MNKIDAEKLILTIVSAYVWVSSADEGVDVTEYKRFEKVIVGSPFATHFSFEDMRHTFKDMVTLFETDFDYAIKLTKERLLAYVEEPFMAEEILRLSRVAVVGDGQLQEVEELVLGQIASQLNLNIDRA